MTYKISIAISCVSSSVTRVNPYIFSVLAIAIAAHGQGHTSLETEYGYDPIKILRG